MPMVVNASLEYFYDSETMRTFLAIVVAVVLTMMADLYFTNGRYSRAAEQMISRIGLHLR